MYNQTDTIYALASGLGVAGVAVIRISGKQSLTILKKMTTIKNPLPNHAYCSAIFHNGNILDRGVILYFKSPHSFTGEDIVELQIHGGRGVIQSILTALSTFKSCRPAERGEFSRRAVINGKMDLTEAEGLLDLVHAETEQQRRQALAQMDGNLFKLYEMWRNQLVHHLAYAEAFIDFPEEDIPHEKELEINSSIKSLITQIKDHLNDEKRGERLRDGFQIAIIGAPNVGKSSLINALTHKEVAIVSQIAGTTRDIVEAHLDVDGFPVILADTAGLRNSTEQIEAEGIKRAVKKAEEADLILFVQDATQTCEQTIPKSLLKKQIITIWNKNDLLKNKTIKKGHYISAKTGAGITKLWNEIRQILFNSNSNGAVITRERYRVALKTCLDHLKSALQVDALELKTEDLRMAARSLGRITGRIEVDELLDVIFRDFCIGK